LLNSFLAKKFPWNGHRKYFSSAEFFSVRLCHTEQRPRVGRKGGDKMNNMKLVVSVLFLGGVIGLSGISARAESLTSARAQGVISQDVLTEGSYCHTKFESIREETLASSRPVLKDSDDFVDFYGPCNRDPLGQDEIQAQKIEAQHRFANDYED
jgi:hypothetical protein